MAGLTQAEKIENGWEWLEQDFEKVTEDATARELAGIAWRANSNIYYQVGMPERRKLLMKVGEMAGRQSNQAASLALVEDIASYGSVSNQAFAWAHNDDLDSDRLSSFNAVLGITETKNNSNMFVLAERIIGFAHALRKPGLDTDEVRELMSELTASVERSLEAYDQSSLITAEKITRDHAVSETVESKSSYYPYYYSERPKYSHPFASPAFDHEQSA